MSINSEITSSGKPTIHSEYSLLWEIVSPWIYIFIDIIVFLSLYGHIFITLYFWGRRQKFSIENYGSKLFSESTYLT